jgi:hypothetical protein
MRLEKLVERSKKKLQSSRSNNLISNIKTKKNSKNIMPKTKTLVNSG